MGDPEWEQLRQGLAAGQEAAFAALYRVYGTRLLRTAHTLLGQAADAEDAVQEVLVAVIRARHRLQHVENLSAYLFASLRHAATRIAARRSREPRSSVELNVVEQFRVAQPDHHADSEPMDERAAWLRTTLERLPAEQREIIALKIDGELTFAEIGAALGISPHTAASRYRYALEKLRSAAQDQY